ncbi:MAG: mechanosensitive ion channel [Saprospiraceae bacterium]|nr:mechanosensitive ion channel [Saprospiraceae bacterium]MCB9323215.1 mechanosensitive ion channel [Lewinellaceae bacterium]
MDFNNIPTSLLILLLIRAFWIVAFFGFIQHILLKAIRNERLHDFVAFYTPLFKNVAWILFTINMIYTLAKVNPIVSMAVIGSLLALGWQPARDFIQGTIFRFQNGDISGQLLKIKHFSGVVSKMNNTKIELRIKNGEIVQIPYSRIVSAFTTKPAASGRQKTGNIIIDLSPSDHFESKKKELKEKLLNMPWVVSSKGITIEKLESRDEKRQLKISFSTADADHVDRVLEGLKGKD